MAQSAKTRWFLHALAAAAVALAWPVAACAAAADGVAPGQLLGDAALTGLNGPPRRLSAYRGRPLVINVWASWCGPCRAESASLERLAWSEAGQGFAVIGISTDDDAQAARAWLARSHATLTHFIDHDLVLERLLGASSLPLTVLVDADGRVVDKVHGARDWDSPEAVAAIRRAFGGRPATPPPARGGGRS